jgi:hypothetical protein
MLSESEAALWRQRVSGAGGRSERGKEASRLHITASQASSHTCGGRRGRSEEGGRGGLATFTRSDCCGTGTSRRGLVWAPGRSPNVHSVQGFKVD